MKLEDARAALDAVRRQVRDIEEAINEGNLVRAASWASDLIAMSNRAFNRLYELTYPKPEEPEFVPFVPKKMCVGCGDNHAPGNCP